MIKPISTLGRLVLFGLVLCCVHARAAQLKVARFDIDATPPVGSMMAYDPVKEKGELSLRARGIVLLGAGEPIVLCAVDWIGIGNEGHDVFCSTLAEAAGTSASRVAVHTVHQHDAPGCDFATERILKELNAPLYRYEGSFAREVLGHLSTAVKESLAQAKPVTHLGLGQAEVKEIASNRRILGPDGKVRAVRYTATKSAELRAEPEGTIDPVLSLVSFWNGNTPVAALSYYACHPQSYYRTGIANPDFPGVARFLRQQEEPDALHIHFNGAAGNVGAGKYNDGARKTRWVLAQRLADGMRRAWDATKKTPISSGDVDWRTELVALPVAEHLKEEELLEALKSTNEVTVRTAATDLAWVRRAKAGHKHTLSCLAIGSARILHMPGEVFVEYQLAAKQMRPELFVAMAAYGDYGTGYIGTAVAFTQGGYETSPTATNVAPGVEGVLMEGMRKLLLRDK